MNPIKLREDLDVNLIQELDNQFIYISDPLLIAEPIALPFVYYPLIQLLIEGSKTADKIANDSSITKLLNLTKDKIYTLLNNMESLYLIDSDTTRIAVHNMQSYLNGNVRHSYCHSFTYPEKPEELDIFLEQILKKGKIINEGKVNAILAPHIDLRLEESWEIYANSFLPLSNINNIDTVIILGTAHYRSSSDFMFTKKDFITPYGIVHTNQELLNEIEKSININYDDIAHYKEHSIEFHLLFLQKLLPQQEFKILPILTGTPAKYLEEKKTPDTNENYNKVITAIKQALLKIGGNTLILSSGDMSHIGRKFGDEFSAENELERIRKEDENFINNIVNGNKNDFFEDIIKSEDKNKICGTSPFYAALSLLDINRVINTGYNQWNEIETESMVSFAGFIVE